MPLESWASACYPHPFITAALHFPFSPRSLPFSIPLVSYRRDTAEGLPLRGIPTGDERKRDGEVK